LLLSQGSGAYLEQYQQLQANNKVTRTDRERIAAIKDTGSKESKQEVLKLVMDNATDEGDKLLKVNADMADNLQKLAADLIPATLVIKQGILEVVRWVAKLSGNDNAKAFVASEDLKAIGGRYGIEISGKNGNDKPLIDKDAALQKFLTFEKNYAQDLPGWKDDAYKMLHNAGEDFNQLQADYQAHKSAFPKETPQLLANMQGLIILYLSSITANIMRCP